MRGRDEGVVRMMENLRHTSRDMECLCGFEKWNAITALRTGREEERGTGMCASVAMMAKVMGTVAEEQEVRPSQRF
jgi:hypothetical protein